MRSRPAVSRRRRPGARRRRRHRRCPSRAVGATLTVPASVILEALNETTRTEIANIRDEPVDCAIAKCLLDLTATRTGTITGHAADGRLSLDVPLAATAQLELKTALFKTHANSLTTGAVHADTAISLGPDWHLRTDTQGKMNSPRPSSSSAHQDELRRSWNRNQASLSAPLFKTLDRHIASGVKIRPQAERLWQKAQLPIRVGKSPEAWLVLAPERIRVSGPVTRERW